MVEIEIDDKIIRQGLLFGLVEFRDGHYYSTEKGNQVIIEYLKKLETSS